MTANTLEQRARELLAAEYDRYGLCGSYYITNPDMGELTGTEPDDPPISVVLSSIESALRLSAGADDAARLDALEALLDEQTNGMLLLHHGAGVGRGITGLGLRNTGRSLRAAIDEAALQHRGDSQEVGRG